MKIIFEINNHRYSVETPYEHHTAAEVIELATRLMVVAGYSPRVIQDGAEDGSWEWVQEDEEVVKRREECQ